jgi:hypothetical protein
VELAMKVSDLTMCECKVREAAETGTLVDLRVSDPAIDSPEKWAEWGPERSVRAEVIADLLIGNGEAASVAVRGVRLQGARITGDLNLEASTLRCPLALLNCSFEKGINLNEATVISVRLSGSQVPAVHARQLRTRGDLRLDEGFRVSDGVELYGAHIGGQLSCTGGQFTNPNGLALSARGLTVDQDMFCGEGFAASGEVRLLGAHIRGNLSSRGGQFTNPNGLALTADRLTVDGSMFCRDGFAASGEVSLQRAHIGGQLSCTGGEFSNPGGYALNADSFSVEGHMYCDHGFAASGEVSLLGAHIGGWLDCTGGQFSNADGRALTADRLTVDQDMYCDHGFAARGEVSLLGAHIGGQLDCTGGQFSNADGIALNADRLTVDGSMVCGEGFSASGEVRLLGAHINSQLDCAGGQFSNPGGYAISADGLTVEQGMFCREGFSASGEVRLPGAHINGILDCRDSQFSNPGGSAISLKVATVNGRLRMESAVLQGILDLTGAKTSSYQDNPTTGLQKLRLDGFVYDAIEGATAKERLQWLRRNEKDYSPQIYNQLASVYRRTGHDEDSRRILIAKQRRRFAQGNVMSKIGGFLLDVTVGYGYRTWLAAFWLVGFLILGTWLFGSVYRGDLTPASNTTVPPLFQPFFYTLDLLLPVISLHVRDAWIAQGSAQVLSVIFIIMGWILATAVVLSLTGLLKRD